jgi:phage recombination protein Bet
MSAAIAEASPPVKQQSLIVRFSERLGLEPTRMVATLKATVFRTEKPITDEQLAALLLVAEEYKLNPFTKELFAFVDKNGSVVPFVSVDGWVSIVNDHPQMDGVTFEHEEDGSACTCLLYRKDRSHPVIITEYLSECRRDTVPWRSHPRRMLRHKAFMQCARVAFGFAGIHDEDEAQRIVHGGDVERLDETGEVLTLSAQSPAEVVKQAARKARKPPPDDEPPASETQPHVPKVPPPTTPNLAAFEDALDKAPDADEAALIMDRGRTSLPPEEYAALVEHHRTLKWDAAT